MLLCRRLGPLGCSKWTSKFNIGFRCFSSIKVGLTASRFQQLQRKPYGILRDNDVQQFEKMLGTNNVLTDPNDLEGFNGDWNHNFKGQSKAALRPRNVEELRAVLRHCFERNLAVCPQGGNTGLVGGSVPVFDEVVLLTTGMNKVLNFDPVSGVVACEAGCVLEALDAFVRPHNYMVPLDLGSKGSCVIGGNVSTAAGGMRLLRYGSLHAHVLGLEAVLADNEATVLSDMKGLRKDNTGFHLPHLFVGAEGQLGVVSKVVMTCVPKPHSVSVALFGCSTFENCCKLLSQAKQRLGEILSSFEFLDSAAMRCVEENLNLQNPLTIPDANFYILIETAGSNPDHDGEKMSIFLQSCVDQNLVLDGTIAADEKQAQRIWALRERCAEALLVDGYVYKQDFSLKLTDFYEMVEVARMRVGDRAKRVIAYGHLGDGNLHLNITAEQYSEDLNKLLYPFLYEWVRDHGGSISAEHGLGFAKRNYAHFSNSASMLEQMKRLKRLFDPLRLLNPYKTLPD